MPPNMTSIAPTMTKFRTELLGSAAMLSGTG